MFPFGEPFILLRRDLLRFGSPVPFPCQRAQRYQQWIRRLETQRDLYADEGQASVLRWDTVSRAFISSSRWHLKMLFSVKKETRANHQCAKYIKAFVSSFNKKPRNVFWANKERDEENPPLFVVRVKAPLNKWCGCQDAIIPSLLSSVIQPGAPWSTNCTLI